MKKVCRGIIAGCGVAVCILTLYAMRSFSADQPVTSSVVSGGGDALKGKGLFIKNGCFACHGYVGQGGSYTGPQIAPNPLPWQAVAAFIRNPRGLNPPYLNWPFNVMPPFTAKMVTDQDVQDIVAYLSSVPEPVAIQEIPTFK